MRRVYRLSSRRTKVQGERDVSSFEFFTVLLSIIVSLGVASLLHNVVRLIQEAARVKFSLTWALWAATIFNVQVIYWFRAWAYHEQFTISARTAIPPLILAILAFMACGLATPHIADAGSVDLREFHARQGRKYQVAYAAFMAVAVVQGLLMAPIAGNADNLARDSIVEGVAALLAIACAIFHRQTWLQIICPILFLISGLAYYGTLLGN